MRLLDIKNKEKVNNVVETVTYLQQLRSQLTNHNDSVSGDSMFILEQKYEVSYVLQTLSKLEKISGYLVKTKLQNTGDIDRYESFLSVMQIELPKLESAFATMKLDLSNIHTLQRRHELFNN